jgi:hypothetical protein
MNKLQIKKRRYEYNSKLEVYLRKKLYMSGKRSVKNVNVNIDYLIEEYWNKYNGCCFLSGIKMRHSVNGNNKIGYLNCSIDQRIPKRGYFKGNVSLVCTFINFAKTNMSEYQIQNNLLIAGRNIKNGWNIPQTEATNEEIDYLKKKLSDKNITQNVSLDYIVNLWNKSGKRCVLTGIEMEIAKEDIENKCYNKVSIDRINSEKGYSEDNVQLVCLWVNYSKQKMTNKQFQSLIVEASDNIETKNTPRSKLFK